MEEQDYLIRRAAAQLELARGATIRDVMVVHLELSSLYLERVKAMLEIERRQERRSNVIPMRR